MFRLRLFPLRLFKPLLPSRLLPPFRHFQLFGAAIAVAVIFLPLSTAARSAEIHKPTVFWASDPVEPGETVQVSGIDLDGISSVLISRLDDMAPKQADSTGQSLRAKSPEVIQAVIVSHTAESLSFTLPSGLESGVFSARMVSGGPTAAPQNTIGDDGVTVMLNAPDIYWLQGDREQSATSGGWLRVSGRNIARNANAILRLTDGDSRRFDISVEAPDLWSATFRLPSTLPAGKYRADLFNGNGDQGAWRPAGEIMINAPAPAPSLKLDLYPQADGTTQDVADANRDAGRINAAMASLAARGGGTLFLHGGIYDLTGTLLVPDGVSLKGEATDLVTLAWRDSESPPPALITGVSNFTIENLSISAQRHLDVIRGGFAPALASKTAGASAGAAPSAPGSIAVGPAIGSNITLRNLTIRADAFMGHLVNADAEQRLAPMLAAIKDGVAGLRLADAISWSRVATSSRPSAPFFSRQPRVSGCPAI